MKFLNFPEVIMGRIKLPTIQLFSTNLLTSRDSVH